MSDDARYVQLLALHAKLTDALSDVRAQLAALDAASNRTDYRIVTAESGGSPWPVCTR